MVNDILNNMVYQWSGWSYTYPSEKYEWKSVGMMTFPYIYIYVERTFWVYFVPTFICPHALSTMILGKVPSAMVLLFGLPLHVFVVCCWGGKIVPLRAWSKSSLTLISLLRMPFIISSCCNLGERVCSCLLLLGWQGCRLVYLFAVARVQGLAQALFRRLGSSAPPPFTSLTSPSWRIFIYLFMGRKRVLFCQSRRQVSSENHVFPFVRCVFHLISLFSYVTFLFLYSYRDERVVSWPLVLHLFI